MNIAVAKSLFEKLNLSDCCQYFEDGQKIINHVKLTLKNANDDHPISLLLLDLQMPMKNGLQVV